MGRGTYQLHQDLAHTCHDHDQAEEVYVATAADWTMKAFDRIRHRIPKGMIPAGCRAQDQEIYRQIIRQLDGVNLAEHFDKQHIRTCFQSEKQLMTNEGQRIDHIIVEPSMVAPGESKLRVAYDTLLQFGGSRKGSSDHCPLWMRLERGPTIKPVIAAILVEDGKSESLDPEVLKQLDRMADQPCLQCEPVFGEPTEEFENAEPTNSVSWDDECDDFAEACNLQDDDDKQRPFEDCSTPVIHCCIRSNTNTSMIPVKVLVDSGSTLDLISGEMARKLQRNGYRTEEVQNGVKIKVANGKRSTLNQMMALKLQIKAGSTESREFLVLEDLPFDLIVGSETCKRWKASIDWEQSRFSITPGIHSNRVDIEWNIYRGQHWRRWLIQTTTIPPESQMVINVKNNVQDYDGYSSKAGLVTPLRGGDILTNKCRAAYMYGEGIEKTVVLNMSKTPVTITAGTPVAEFHPRSMQDLRLTSTKTVKINPQTQTLGLRTGGS